MRVTDSGIHGAREFPSTSWSVIVNLQDPSSPEHARHLERLVELYWKPVYSVIRHGFGRAHADAKDLTQEFFATVVLDRELVRSYAPERGSFRALLRTALGRFMQDVGRGAARQKRGGGVRPLSLDHIGDDAVTAIPGAERLGPDEIFDLAWNASVMNEALVRLEARLAAEGKTVAFEAFRRYDLEADEGGPASYADIGRRLSLSVPQVKHALGLARAAFREIVTEIVRGYVDDPAELAAELRRLTGS